MIDEKKIKKAADEYCAPLFSETTPRPHRQSWSCDTIIFKAGINWFKENLWHDASEEPEGDGEILVLCGNKVHYANTLTAHNRKVTKWRAYVEDWFITRWLYIEDLMKGGSND